MLFSSDSLKLPYACIIAINDGRIHYELHVNKLL